MAIRPRDVYRSRRPWRNLVTGVLLGLVLLLAVAVGLFYGLQRYLVVTQDGVELQIPFLMESGTPAPDGSAAPGTAGPEVDVVVESADYSQLRTDPGAALTQLQGIYVPMEAVMDGTWENYLTQAAGLDANALVLELKSGSGALAWNSQVDMAVGYGTAGSVDLAPVATAIREAGYAPVALIPACVDEALATRYGALALRTADGQLYSDSAGYWLDPYNQAVQAYAADLTAELYSLGFDEVILSRAAHPDADAAALTYSQDATQERSPGGAVGSFAAGVLRNLGTALDEGKALSTVMEPDALRGDLASRNGQEGELLFSLYDRVYLNSDIYTAAYDRELAAPYVQSGDAAVRFVPIVDGGFPEGGSALARVG